MLSLTADQKQTSFHSIEEATGFLLEKAAQEDVLHLSYWYLQYKDGMPDQVIWVATYDPAYMSHYMSNFTPLDDPVITSVMEDKYVDWSEWFDVDHLAQSVDSIATRYGITRYGISMPLRGPNEDKIIFSVCIESDAESWPEARNNLAKRLLPIAKMFDRRMRALVLAGEEGESVFRLSA